MCTYNLRTEFEKNRSVRQLKNSENENILFSRNLGLHSTEFHVYNLVSGILSGREVCEDRSLNVIVIRQDEKRKRLRLESMDGIR